MGDIKTLVNDPRFQALDPATQRSVLGQADARFSSLSDADIKTFIGRATAGNSKTSYIGNDGQSHTLPVSKNTPVLGGPAIAGPASVILPTAFGMAGQAATSALGGSPLVSGIVGLLFGASASGVRAGIQKIASLPTETQGTVLSTIGKAIGRYVPGVKEILSLKDLHDVITEARPKAGVVPPTEVPVAAPGSNTLQIPGQHVQVDPYTPPPTPSPVPRPPASTLSIPGQPVEVGSPQPVAPVRNYTLPTGSPTGSIPSAPAEVSGGPSLSDRDSAALELGKKIFDTQDAKSQAIVDYWKTHNIDPASVDEASYAAHEKAAGYSRSKNPTASLARTQQLAGAAPDATISPSPASNIQQDTPPVTALEDTLKKSIKQAQSVEPPKGIKASKGTTKTSPTKASAAAVVGGSGPLPAIPSAPVSDVGGTFTYGGATPTWEFKRNGPGVWGQRDFGTDQPFTALGGPQSADLEESYTNNELKRTGQTSK